MLRMSGRIHLLRDETPNWLSITKWSAQKSYTIHIQVALNELSRLCVCVCIMYVSVTKKNSGFERE